MSLRSALVSDSVLDLSHAHLFYAPYGCFCATVAKLNICLNDHLPFIAKITVWIFTKQIGSPSSIRGKLVVWMRAMQVEDTREAGDVLRG